MGSLQQTGLSPDILINFLPLGKTTDGKIRVPFHRPLNFADSIMQIVNGYAKLISHCVTGLVSMRITYFNSGKDHDAPAPQRVTGGRGAKKKVVKPPTTAVMATDEMPVGPKVRVQPPSPNPGTSAQAAEADDEYYEVEEEITSSQESIEKRKRGGRGGRRHKRTTPAVVRGVMGALPSGTTLERRLRVINDALNSRTTIGNKLINWPMAVCETPDGRVRSRWSCFSLLAITDPDFWRQLGFVDSQIYRFVWDATPVYALGPMPMAHGGDVTSIHQPLMNSTSLADAYFHLIPRQLPAHLEFQLYVQDAPATPAGMTAMLEQLIAAGNYKYRHSVLEFPFTRRHIWPEGAEYNPGINSRVTLTVPNILPLFPHYEYDKVKLTVNTQTGQGSVRAVDFDERNVFGMHEHYKTWDDYSGSNVRRTIESSLPLGVRNQQCEVTSNDVFLSRTTMRANTTGAALCALFFNTDEPGSVPHPITYFPKNVLSSGASFNFLEFTARSRYIHPTVVVTKEVFEVSFIGEIRNL